MHRRAFLRAAAAFSTCMARANPTVVPVVDTHIHLFDPTRAEGVPWPPKEDHVLYKPALPDRYRKVTAGLDVVGAIEIECSPWSRDNEWVLDVAAKNPIILGTIGDLEPSGPEFFRRLDQLHKNPLWLGIRYGNLWDRDLGKSLSKPEFVAGLKALADAGLTLDTANPTLDLLESVLRATDKIPSLRVVIDHLPQFEVPSQPGARERYHDILKGLSARPQVYVKISEVPRRIDGRVRLDTEFYRARLDDFWQRFGDDRVLFGSDWPNSDLWAEYPQILHLVRDYASTKSAAAQNKFFWRNSRQTYRWAGRNSAQRSLFA